MDDGLLDICLVRDATTRRVLQILPKALLGGRGLNSEPEIDIRRVTRISLVSELPLPMHADGEIIKAPVRQIEAKIRPRALKVLTL